MRLTAQEKEEIIRLVDRSELGVNKTLKELGLHKSMFYNWYRLYLAKGKEGLNAKCTTRQQWNTIPEEQKQLVVEIALEHPALSPRELAVRITDEQRIFIPESSVYRILKAQGLVTTPAHILLSASNEFKDKPCFVHELWQTDFTQTLKSWGGVGTTSRPSWMIFVRFTQALGALQNDESRRRGANHRTGHVESRIEAWSTPKTLIGQWRMLCSD